MIFKHFYVNCVQWHKPEIPDTWGFKKAQDCVKEENRKQSKKEDVDKINVIICKYVNVLRVY